MIADLCKPFNEGEQPLVRIYMSIEEAQRLFAYWKPVKDETLTAVELDEFFELLQHTWQKSVT